MKYLIAITFATLLAFTVGRAAITDVQHPVNYAYTANYISLNVGTGFTNSASTNRIDQNLYHTVHVYNTSAASEAVTIWHSLDSTNWVQLSSNNVAATSQFATNWVGKVGYIKILSLGTNATGAVIYLGGR